MMISQTVQELPHWQTTHTHTHPQTDTTENICYAIVAWVAINIPKQTKMNSGSKKTTESTTQSHGPPVSKHW